MLDAQELSVPGLLLLAAAVDLYSVTLLGSMVATGAAAVAALALERGAAPWLRPAGRAAVIPGALGLVVATVVHAVRGHGAASAAPMGPAAFATAHPALLATALLLATTAWALWRRGGAARATRSRAVGAPSWPPRMLLAIGLAALTTLAIVQRWPGLAPPWVWLDDQWVLALVLHASPRQLLVLAPPAPIGFVLLLKVIGHTLGTGPGPMQLLPLVAGLAQIPLVGWIAARATRSVPLGLFAAALLAGSRTLGVYSLRVKQFTLEGLVVLLLVALAARCVRRPGGRAFLVVPAAALAAIAVSFTALPVGVVIVHGLVLHALSSRDEAWRAARRVVVASTVLYDLGVVAALLLLRAGPAGDAIVSFWSGYFLPLDSAAATWRFLGTRGADFLTGAVPGTLAWLAVGVPAAIGLLLARASTRTLGLTVLAFYGGMLAASALHLYPIGGKRTDVFSYPVTVLVITAAVWCLAGWRWLQAAPWVALALVVAELLLFWPRSGLSYPPRGGRDVVELANAVVGPEDALIVAPFANWALGCHGRWPVRLARAVDSTNGFRVELDRPRTLVLRESRDGVHFRDDRTVVREQVEPFVATAAPPRVVLVTIGMWPYVDEEIEEAMGALGYRGVAVTLPSGARLVRYERGPDSSPVVSPLPPRSPAPAARGRAR